jgi:hypothetical protein
MFDTLQLVVEVPYVQLRSGITGTNYNHELLKEVGSAAPRRQAEAYRTLEPLRRRGRRGGAESWNCCCSTRINA